MKNRKRVALFEFPVFTGAIPLASGHLEARARLNPNIEEQFEFEKISIQVGTPNIEKIVATTDADVLGFSCYVWNTGLVKRLLPSLLARRPRPWIVLGGPQVINKAARYLDPAYENLMICNGEGEQTFANVLEQLGSPQPDFTKVNGLSFYRDNALITTPKQERIHNLEETPSPYLSNYFNPEKGYAWALLETNRGCPFTCTYCFWGAATNAKVHTFDMERIRGEITWISEKRVPFLFIADANFGMLARDQEITDHIVQCRKKNGYPVTVYFSSSKNTPERVTEIIRKFETAGVLATQPISLQTLNPEVLKNVRRNNIKPSTYTDLQRAINERGLSSFIEIIWPLPGETLKSFKENLGNLCANEADSFEIYPLLIINNVELERQQTEFGLVTMADPNPDSEAQIVVSTKDVNNVEYREGLRFARHLHSLYGLRGLRHVGRYLDSNGKMQFVDLISAFSEFCKQAKENRYADYVEQSVLSLSHYRFSDNGAVVHLILHSDREEFDRFLLEFVRTLPWWAESEVRFLFELDLLNRPHVYLNTPILNNKNLELIRILSVEKHGYTVELPSAHVELARKFLELDFGEGRTYARINYHTNQWPYMPKRPQEVTYSYCQDRAHKIRNILPIWTISHQHQSIADTTNQRPPLEAFHGVVPGPSAVAASAPP
jgi:radical SAM superfamily enzyme YgiQ (UPF0313 family)